MSGEQKPQLQNSPDEVYESVFAKSVHASVDLIDKPLSSETPEEGRARGLAKLQAVRDGERSQVAQAALHEEAELFGIPVDGDMGEFLDRHKQFMLERNAEYGDAFESVKNALPNMVVGFIDPNDVDLPKTLTGRLDETSMTISDIFYDQGSERLATTGAMGGYNAAARLIKIYHNQIVSNMMDGIDPEDIKKEIDVIIQHELIHGLFSAWYNPDELFSGVKSNGLSVTTEEGKHGELLSEGTIEKFRSELFGTDFFSYEPMVMALAAADAVDENYEHQRVKSAVTGEGRGEVVGRFEEIFGPLALEKIDEMMGQLTKYSDISADYRTQLLSMVQDDSKREVAAAAFDEMFNKGLKHRDRIKAQTGS